MHSLPTRQLPAGETVLLNPTLKDISLTPEDILLLDRMGVPPERRDEFVQDVAQILYAVFDTLFQ
ncbi:MAG: hypothetical protein NT023_10455 [Armatimonadetes bacterium]|nr:hypothetical protein [Armatimonadota bacterium]